MTIALLTPLRKTLPVLIALLTGQGILASHADAAPQDSNARAVSLNLNDVQHVLGRSLTATIAASRTPHAMGVCTSVPPLTEYNASFDSPMSTKGVINVIGLVDTYRSVAGPVCYQKSEITMFKLGGALLKEVMTPVHGVGTQAFLLDTTGPKTKEAPVYTVALKFTRGNYRAVVIVQSHRTIKTTDMIALGTVMDTRMKRHG